MDGERKKKKNVNVLQRCSFKTSKYIIIKREKILYARLQDYSGLFDLLVNVQGCSVLYSLVASSFGGFAK